MFAYLNLRRVIFAVWGGEYAGNLHLSGSYAGRFLPIRSRDEQISAGTGAGRDRKGFGADQVGARGVGAGRRVPSAMREGRH